MFQSDNGKDPSTSPGDGGIKPEEGALAVPKGGVDAKGAARRHITCAYRAMHPDEAVDTLKTKQLQGLPGGREIRPTTEKWFTTDVKHSRKFIARKGHSLDKTVEFQMRKKGFQQNVANDAVPQRETRKNPGKNVFNNEKGVRNYAAKGPENINNFNKEVVKVKKINPNTGNAMKFLSKHKVAAGASLIAVAVDSVNIYIAVKADDGKFGPCTTIAVSESAGGLAGAFLGAEIGAAVGSVFPGLGTIIGGFIGGLIGGVGGSLSGGGIASLFIEVPYQPTPQWTEIIPFHGDPKFFKPHDIFDGASIIAVLKPDEKFFKTDEEFFKTDGNSFKTDEKFFKTDKDFFKPDSIF